MEREGRAVHVPWRWSGDVLNPPPDRGGQLCKERVDFRVNCFEPRHIDGGEGAVNGRDLRWEVK